MDDIKSDDVMLTVFLKHDQSQPLDEFQSKLDDREWWEKFPPEGVEIVSWNVVMGVGQIATLKMPPSKIQAVNVALEKFAWGVFRTEVYATYDFMAVRDRLARESKDRQLTGGGENPESIASVDVNSGAGGGDRARLPHNGLYMEQWQAGTGNATPYEAALGNALEEVFSAGIYDLSGIVKALNRMGVKTPDEEVWTEEGYAVVMEKLGR